MITTHINEQATILSNLKKVQAFQDEIHNTYCDGDFLRLYNDNFDKQINGKVVSCDISIYDFSIDTSTKPMADIELIISAPYSFYKISYTTDFGVYMHDTIEKYDLSRS